MTDGLPDRHRDFLIQLLEDAAKGHGGSFEVLVQRPRRMVARAQTTTGPVIVKLWDLSDIRGSIRSLAGRTKGRAEFLALERLAEHGFPAPGVQSWARLSGHIGAFRFHEVLCMQDISPCTSLAKILHRAAKAGDDETVRALDKRIIMLTRSMIDAGVLDNDHRVGNFLVLADGDLRRIDFENAVLDLGLPARIWYLGVMLGALVSSHGWMCRHRPEYTPRFLASLVEAIAPSDLALMVTRRKVRTELKRFAPHSEVPLQIDLFRE